jgi:hypothetical protein
LNLCVIRPKTAFAVEGRHSCVFRLRPTQRTTAAAVALVDLFTIFTISSTCRIFRHRAHRWLCRDLKARKLA